MIEEWKDVPGFGGHFEASTFGRLRSKERTVTKRHKSGCLASQRYKARVIGSINPEGYYFAHVSVDGKKMNLAIHRMVALAFHGPPKTGQECCHNNGNPSDNRPENLRWDTHLANNRDRLAHGTYRRGREHPMAKFETTLLDEIAAGRLNKRSAMAAGVSHTHFYRIRKLAEAERLA